MMVVMVVSAVLAVLNVAMLLVAMLAALLQLERDVSNAVLRELLSHSVLDLVCIGIGDDMHRGVMAFAVHAPNVDMVDVQHAVDLENMLSKLGNLHAVRSFLQKE